ncbi:copper chaperone CopZ [Arcicella aurantiaca]|uniref:Copper chaperone CopZ n=1 Tax=Arcicella aurantiaca TaxID=591202 RepID=A0A316DG48_9BACT|nr:heavy-metal-associated domain-containing protein [Arcicella aurantiaca]PWK17181.1 copper chaperone CopZ [Arcicella aurantiaca]
MNRRLFLATSLTITTFLSRANGKTQTVKIKTSAVCGMCQDKIENAFKTIKGVEKVALDLESNILTIDFDNKKVSVSELKSTLTKLGYDANELKATKEGFEKLPHCCKKM